MSDMSNLTAWPTTVDASLPKGVEAKDINVHTYKRHGARNILEQAAMCDCRDWAASLIASVLNIDASDKVTVDLMKANLSEPDRWARISVESRAMELGNWMRAQCFEICDFVRAPAVNTLGD